MKRRTFKLSRRLAVFTITAGIAICSVARADNCHWQQEGVDGPGWYGGDGYPCVTTPNMPQERWDSRWGAIALSASTGKMGAAAKRITQKYAERAAVRQCKAASGASDCEVRAVYRNECAAYARWGDSFAIYAAPSIEDASLGALATCNEHGGGLCQILYADCSLAERVW